MWTRNDLWVLPLTGDRKPTPLMQTPFNEFDGHFSPDARWVAYSSDESGQSEVYVTPFPATGEKWRVSPAGGGWLRWRGDGNELFYVVGNTIMSVEVNGTGRAFHVGMARPLFQVRRRTDNYLGYGTGSVYDVAPIDKRKLGARSRERVHARIADGSGLQFRNLLTRVVVPTGRPPRLLIEIGIAKCAHPSLRGRSEQIRFKGFRCVSIDAADLLRIDDD